jgi:hypothetical protein
MPATEWWISCSRRVRFSFRSGFSAEPVGRDARVESWFDAGNDLVMIQCVKTETIDAILDMDTK